MRKLKDFFYDKNDILIVLIIVAAAAFIIYTRIDAIMEYPEKAAQAVQEAELPSEGQESSIPEEASDKKKEPDKKTDEADEPGSNTTISITIKDSDTSISVSERLAEAGLVSSAEEFESFIANNDKAGSLQTGTFEIPSGSSDEEILNIIAP